MHAFDFMLKETEWKKKTPIQKLPLWLYIVRNNTVCGFKSTCGFEMEIKWWKMYCALLCGWMRSWYPAAMYRKIYKHMTRFRGLPRNLDAVFVCAKRISHKSFDCYSIIIHIEIFAVYKPWFQFFFFFWFYLGYFYFETVFYSAFSIV